MDPDGLPHSVARMSERSFGGGCVAQCGTFEGGHKALPYNSCTGERRNTGAGIKKGDNNMPPFFISMELAILSLG